MELPVVQLKNFLIEGPRRTFGISTQKLSFLHSLYALDTGFRFLTFGWHVSKEMSISQLWNYRMHVAPELFVRPQHLSIS